ncbi:Gfo/Idh/MocA family protein [Arenibaculum pallidiluteum]|uniref:Gfo/Idh/MocA family protein n=1 Tax=Arenibaculum pallidiluteum TaxID=2812559 RepID=UPI001A958F74|nr:Gfo/Idh/MocA family oxidoreductase [Arenibaculum pallidiluteum]
MSWLGRKIGVGIVGASANRGWASVAHIPAIHALRAFEIRGVSTTRLESASATADRLGVDLAFDTHQALVSRPEIDLVVVAVKVPAHREIVADSLAAGKMVFCEWPLGRNLAEAEELAGLAREKQLKTVIGLQGGLHPPIRFLRDIIHQGAIGLPLSTSIRAHPTEDMWVGRYDPPFEFMAQTDNGATLLSIAVGQALEPLAQVLGEFSSLSAVIANQRGDGIRLRDGLTLPKNAPDEIAIAGHLRGGIVASLHYSAGLPSGPPMVWEIQGTEGSLRIEGPSGYIHLGDLAITCRRGQAPAQRLTVPASYAKDDLGLGAGAAGVARLYAQFASDLQSGTSIAPDFQTALSRHRALDAISRASETGLRQDVMSNINIRTD